MKLMKELLASAITSVLIVGGAHADISDNTVKLGYIADMSGMYRDLAGPNGLKAIEMAVADFGGQINGATIEVVSADDRNSADVASTTVRKWVENDQVDMVSSGGSSSTTIAAISILEESNKLGLISGSAASSITNEYCSPNHIHYVYDTYALSIGTPTAIVQEGGQSWFILTADYAFGHALESDMTQVIEDNGGKVIGSIRHPVQTSDFSSFILQAQASGADVVALANAGGDTTNAITTAGEFGVSQAGQSIAGLLVFVTDVNALGVGAAQGLLLTTGWYWDMNDETRAWSDRFMDKTGVRPTMVHAGIYSSTIQYLNAVEVTGSDDAQTVRKFMMETPINDMFAKNGRIREDGRMVHDMYLAQVKTPEESTGEWDLYKILRTIPAEEASRPLSESTCKLVTSK